MVVSTLLWPSNSCTGECRSHFPASAWRRNAAAYDDVIFKKLWRWARRRHRGKSAAWVKRKYFTGRADDPWRFRGTVQDKDGGFHTVFLVRAKDTPIRRHVKVRGTANPYDPAWELYFEERLAQHMANSLTGRGTARYLWLEQNGKCLVCGQPLTLAEGWHVHHLLWRAFGGDDDIDNLVLLHPNCHRQVHSEGLVVEKFASREGRL
jgi:RNA-directed DNA polymerase